MEKPGSRQTAHLKGLWALLRQASKRFESAVQKINQLEVIGEPEMSVVGFCAKDPRQLDIFRLNDILSKRGWHLSALQLPSALHMCFTAQHVDTIDALVKVPTHPTQKL